MTKQKIHIIGGPTASGKSARALEIADKENGIVINADSMQVYDDLPILTAQPSAEEQGDIPHKLYSALHPNDPCSAGNWREMVIPEIEEALDKGRTPVIVGGSGLYIKALMDGLSPIPDIPEEIRQAAVKKQEDLGNPSFHAALKERDPEMAQRFHPYHTARLVRAWEVLEATGKSLAEWQKLPRETPPDHWGFQVEIVLPEREELYDRCNRRFVWMIENGALEESEAFYKKIQNSEVQDGVPLTKALGFKALRAYFEDEITLDEAIEKSQAETRQYAKRQTTWFRNQI